MTTSGKREHSTRTTGLGRLIAIAYIILALAATGRSAYQILRKFDEAPVAYSLSAVAALVYILITVGLLNRGRKWRRIAAAGVLLELLGVLIVGALSVLQPDLFPHDTVWSYFGRGYIFLPLILPILGLLYLRKLDREETAHA